MRRDAAGLTAIILVFGWAGATAPLNAQDRLAMAVLSSRPDMVSSGNALVEVKLPSTDGHQDDAGDIHDRVRDFSVREQLRKANGRIDNQVIWVYPNDAAGLGQKVAGLAIDTMSQWLDTLATTSASGAPADRIKHARPAMALDGCWDQTGARIEEAATFDGPGPLQRALPESQESAPSPEHRSRMTS